MKNYLLTTDLNLKPIHYDVLLFPGGEPHVRVDPSYSGDVRIEAYLVNANVFMTLLCLIDAFRRVNPARTIVLTIMYFPGGRQDKVRNIGEAHTLKVYASIINSLKLNNIEILVPHSVHTIIAVENSRVISDTPYINLFIKMIGEELILISPDEGAKVRSLKLHKSLKLPIVYGSKVRDSKTGVLSGFEVDADDLNDNNCIIVDDICDGGGTFIGLAKELKERNAGKLFLYTTHGIFSKGTDELYKYFDKIGCYHTFTDTKVDFVGKNLPKIPTNPADEQLDLQEEEPVRDYTIKMSSRQAQRRTQIFMPNVFILDEEE